MPFRFYVQTFGCKVNQYESQSLREAWIARGGLEVDDPAGAHWIVLNTCAVTAGAVSEARQSVRRLHRLAPQAAIVITGCSATAATRELEALAGVVAVVPQCDKERLLRDFPPTPDPPAGLRAGSEDGAANESGDEPEIGRSHPANAAPDNSGQTDAGLQTPGRPAAFRLPEVPPGQAGAAAAPFPAFSIGSFTRARPVLKVQDGCTHRCTYCIVPLMRGPSVSREPAEVLAEARRLLHGGHRELMLSGINLRQYAVPGRPGSDFWDLLAFLDRELASEWAGTARLRLSSLDPAQLHDKALDTLGSARLVCPHVHLSLQSGSPDVLRAMGRGHYRPDRIPDFLKQLGSVWPLFGLGADILMGFPTERDDHVEETLSLLEALPLSYAHVFPYSPRPGTAAAALPDLPGPVKQARAARVRALAAARQQAFLERLLALPQLTVAPDAAHPDPCGEAEPEPVPPQTLKGVSEYYAGCSVVVPGQMPTGHGLLRVRPQAINGMRLLTSLF